MILFFISFLLIFFSSYFITSILTPKKENYGFIYLLLVAFAQIVLTFEILSLFNSINQIWVLGINIVFFIVSAYLWNKKQRPVWRLNYKEFKIRVINAMKLDKSLIWLYVAFGTFIISSLILCILMPITSADAQSYHVARSLFWVIQGNLNHFDVPDSRNLCLPINSEILYAWVLLFIKKDMFLSLFSFFGYILSIVSVYNIMGYMGYCVRKRLWVIFILSSFSSVIVQASGTETDIIIAGLILSSIYLFWNSLKTDNKTTLFMSALAYALAIGTKTPSLIMIPGIGCLMLFLCHSYKKYKPLAWFLGFGIINFFIFSSYNYILNLIEFGNISGPENFIVVSKNYYGINGAISNFIKYIFMFFDFTGFRWADYVGPHVAHFREMVLNFLHLSYVKDGAYTIEYSVNRSLIEPVMGAGILGFLVFLPCLGWALLKPVFKLKRCAEHKKIVYSAIFAIVFIINLISISYVLVYMAFSVRFIMSFMVVSSPVLVYSYFSNRNPLKYIIIAFSMFYLMGVTTHLWARPLVTIGKILAEHPSISYLREITLCMNFEKKPTYTNSVCLARQKIKNDLTTDNKILVFMGASDCIYLFKSLEFDGYKIDIRNLENAKNINFNDYNIIVTPNREQNSTLIKDYENRKNYYKIENKKLVILKRDPIPCYYLKNETIPNYQETAPYQVKCMMTKDFIEQKNLEMYAATGVISAYTPLGESNYFLFYINKNNPPKFKKNAFKKN